MNIIALRPVAGLIEDLEREDNELGPEPEPDEAVFRRLVEQLVPVPVGGSGQCNQCGQWYDDWNGGVCAACKNNGNGVALLLVPVGQHMPDDEDDACPVCGSWSSPCKCEG